VILIVPIIKNLNIFKEYKMIYVHSKEKIRRKRIESRYNYNEIMINNIINYQKTIDIYKKDSNFVIENNSTLQDLEKKYY
jgi:dephospho-CoA kinase